MADATAERIWNTALGQLQLHVTRPNYDTWLKDTEGLRVEPGVLQLQAHDAGTDIEFRRIAARALE